VFIGVAALITMVAIGRGANEAVRGTDPAGDTTQFAISAAAQSIQARLTGFANQIYVQAVSQSQVQTAIRQASNTLTFHHHIKRCKHLGCRQAGMNSYECFPAKGVRRPRYVVWATPGHREKLWAVGHEIRRGCLKVVAYTQSKLLADALAKRLGGGLVHGSGREWT
jgi:hypothetical protein